MFSPGMAPMFFPWQPPSQGVNLNEVPARVRAAMEYLNSLSFKTMTRAAVNDVGIQEIEGQKLTQGEVVAQTAACGMLTDYFRGNLAPNSWESMQVEAIRRSPHGGTDGIVIRCMACLQLGTIRKDCVLCQGTGQILVFPTASQVDFTGKET